MVVRKAVPRVLLIFCWSLVGSLMLVSSPRAQPSEAAPNASFPDSAHRRAMEIGRPPVQNFAPEDYGAHRQVWAVAQDTSGLLYVGTSSGLTVYDGARWDQISMDPEETGAREQIVRGLTRGPDGTIYVGLIGGFGYLAPDSLGRQRYVSLLDEVPEDQRDFNSVWSVTATPEGVFFLTDERLFRWANGQITSWGTGEEEGKKGAFFLAFAVRGRLYVQKRGAGLLRLERRKSAEGWVLRPVPGGEAFAKDAVYALLPYGREALLVGAAKHGLQRLAEEGTRRPFSPEATAFLKENGLYCGLALPGERYAFGTRRGGVMIAGADGGVESVYDRHDDGLRSDDVKAMARDAQGGLWLALGDGLSRIEWDPALTHFDEKEGLEGAVWRVLRHRGRLYAATNRALYRLRRAALPRGHAQFERLNGTETMIFDMISERETLLAATNKGVMAVRRDGTVEKITIPSTSTTFTLHRSRADSNRVYVGLIDGLAMLEKKPQEHWADARLTVEEVDGTTRTIAQDSTGALWLGTSGSGVVRLADGPAATLRKRLDRAARFDTTRGLPLLTDLFVYELNGRVVVTTPAGLYRHAPARNRRLVRDSVFGARFDGADQFITPVVEGRRHAVWLHAAKDDRRTGAGLYRFTPDGERGYRAETPLAALAGFTVSEFGLFPERDGTLWLGGTDGLYRYAPPPAPPAEKSASGEQPSASPALIRRVATLDADSLLFGGYGGAPASSPTLAYDDGALRFSYAAAGFDAPGETRYRVRLDGLDEDWSHWTKEKRKDYTNLLEGEYVFRVQAEDAHGRLSREASFGFAVLPPWYRTPWAYLAYALTAVSLVAGLVRARSARLKARAARLEKRVEERTAEVRAQQQQLARQAEELEATNRELSNTNDALRTASEQKTELLSIAAHDLATPLTSIKGFAEILLEECPADAPRRKPINVIQRAGEDALQQVEDLRTSASLEGRLAPLNLERVEMKQLAQWILKRFRPQAVAKEQPLRFEAPANAYPVEADAGKLREAMSNYVSNAVKYSPPGRPIDVRLRRTEGAVRFSVEDRGPGLTDADREELFQPFKRLSARPTAGEPSSGLGLYIVKKFVELHDGQVRVESEEGQGSTFYLDLPLLEEDEHRNGTPEGTDAAQDTASEREEMHA